MSPRDKRIIGFFAFAVFAVFVFLLPAFISDFKARDYAYVGIYLIALLGLNVLRLAMVVVLIGWCLNAFGLPGAVIAMLAATAATRAVAIGRIARLMGVSPGAVLPWKALGVTAACALVAAAPALWLARAVPMPPLAAIGAAAAIYAAVYAGLCLRLAAGQAAAPAVPALQNAVR